MKEALKLALDLAIMHHSDDGYAELRSKVRQLAKEALAPTSTPCEVQPEQEPVATIDSLEQEIYENTREFVSLNVMEWLLNRLNTTPPKPEPHNFCPRCGKRLIGMAFAAGGVHTCTPPEGGHQ